MLEMFSKGARRADEFRYRIIFIEGAEIEGAEI
jgi:hypothetical protein